MSAEVVDIRQLAPEQNLSVELGVLASEQDGQQMVHGTYVVLTIGAESISLKPGDAVKVAEMIGEYAKQAAKGSASS